MRWTTRSGTCKERKQFGKAIAEFQGLQFMLADMGMKIEAARQLTYAAAARSERGDTDLTYFGAAAKCFASDVAMEVTTDAVQLLGGYGYTHDYPVERMMRDAKITQIYEGTNQVQRIVMARAVAQGSRLTTFPQVRLILSSRGRPGPPEVRLQRNRRCSVPAPSAEREALPSDGRRPSEHGHVTTAEDGCKGEV